MMLNFFSVFAATMAMCCLVGLIKGLDPAKWLPRFLGVAFAFALVSMLL